jgi:hypothetical protein
MQRVSRLSVLLLAASATMSACSPEEVIQTPVVPTSGVRFINALPDSAGAYGLNFRFVDLVENSTHFRQAFRNGPTTTAGVTASTGIQYKATQSGNRNFVIFLDDTIQAIATTKLKDSTYNFEAGKNYSVIVWGPARAGQMRVTILDETVPDPGAGKVALRVINTGATAIDVRAYKGSTVPTAPTWANVAPYTASSFVSSDTGTIIYNVQPAGGGTALFANATALLGAPAVSTAGAAGKLDIEPVPGTRVAGSGVSLIVWPRSTAGTRAPQTAAFQVPAGTFVWDRRPPRGF